MDECEAQRRVKKYIRENIDLMSNEFLACHTCLTLEAVECLRDHLSDMAFHVNMHNLVSDWEYLLECAIEEDGVDHYFQMIFQNYYTSYMSDDNNTYFIWINYEQD
jgi:hypothetical protein